MFVFMNISTSVDDGKYRASWNYVLRAGRPKYAFLATRAKNIMATASDGER